MQLAIEQGEELIERAAFAAARSIEQGFEFADLAESVQVSAQQLLDIDDALRDLARIDERLVRVVEMRFFAGLTEQDVADALGVTDRTIRRDWEKARLLLRAALT